MQSTVDSSVYENQLTPCGSEKIYLDNKSADVFFTFISEGGQLEKVPAHKHILSSISPVFASKLTDSTNEIDIVGLNSGAFKEFLQFFYFSSVKLSTKNVLEVLSLGHAYKIDGCLDVCMDFCESILTPYSMCWGLEIATILSLDRLKTFCEQQISKHPHQIFRSMSFLLSDSNLLHSILQLNSLKCNESDIFDGCISWARAKCKQKHLNENNMQNLRVELGDLFYEIRFGEMSIEEFYACYCSSRDLFSVEEFECIVEMIALKEFKLRPFNRFRRKGNQLQNK